MADALDLIGVIGTWLAVLLATIALIAVITPWLVLKAAYSEHNQALNSVHDINEDFITRGVGVGRHLRLFHMVRVPRLVPTIDWSEHAAFTVPGAASPWELKHVRGTTCRTGWARFCRLLAAYNPMPASYGTLVIQSHRTWLPVSRYYILTIGLLGRYGDRDDGGKIIDVNPLRPDLNELRLLETSELFKGRRSHSRRRLGYESDGSDVSIESVDVGMMDARYICGTTGSFRRLHLRHSDEVSTDVSSPVIFTLHNDEEIGLVPSPERGGHETPLIKADLSIRRLYWLASGFLTLGNNDTRVACLQTPANLEELEDLDSGDETAEEHLKEDNQYLRKTNKGYDREQVQIEALKKKLKELKELMELDISIELKEREVGKMGVKALGLQESGESGESGGSGESMKVRVQREFEQLKTTWLGMIRSRRELVKKLENKKKEEDQESRQEQYKGEINELARDPNRELDQGLVEAHAELLEGVEKHAADKELGDEHTEKLAVKSLGKFITLELLPTHSRPISILDAAASYGMHSLEISSFQRTTINEDEMDHLVSYARGLISSGISKWLSWKPHVHSTTTVFWKRENIQELVFELLSMDWHPWSYLIWKKNNNYWHILMRRPTKFLARAKVKTLKHMLERHENPEWSSRCHKALEEFKQQIYHYATFHQKRHSVLMKLNTVLGEAHRGNKPSYVVATLFITNDDFRRRVQMLDKQVATTDAVLEVDKAKKVATWVLSEELEVRTKKGRETVSGIILEEEYQYDLVFPSELNTMEEHNLTLVSAREVYLASLWAASSCALWMGSIDSQPLMSFVQNLEDIVHIG